MTRYGKHGKPKQPQMLLQLVQAKAGINFGTYIQGFGPGMVNGIKDVLIQYTTDMRLAWTMAKAEDAHALRGMLMFVFGVETQVICRHLRKTPNLTQPPFPTLSEIDHAPITQ